MVLTQDFLRSILDYNKETGVFTWLVRRGPVEKGFIAGSTGNHGYISISINSKLMLAHRLAFLHVTGCLPKNEVDHINGDRRDNRWINLRDVTRSENQRNSKIRKDNSSGIVGVSWCKKDQIWLAQMQANGKVTIKSSKSFFEACCMRKSYEQRAGFHINHGRIK